MLTTRECRYQRVQEFKDWDHSFLYKNLTDAKKFKVNYTDEFVKSVDAKILISKEYVRIPKKYLLTILRLLSKGGRGRSAMMTLVRVMTRLMTRLGSLRRLS